MAKDNEIRFRELLITLDYLLNYSDEQNPATQQDICRYAREYGLRYDEKNIAGNDIKRQRIGECLRYLMSVYEKHAEQFPFVLETTDSGKYYIEQKNYLNESQIIQILAAIKNDKYTKEEDAEFLVERLLDTLANKNNRDYYKSELQKLDKGVAKYNELANRRIRLINRAYKEGKIIKIRQPVFHNHLVEFQGVWCRVHSIRELQKRQYAFIIPVSKDGNRSRNYIYKPVEYIPVERGKDSEVLCEDFKINRDLNELFKETNPFLAERYGSIERMLKKEIIPDMGSTYVVTFYFKTIFASLVKRSFEEYFYRSLDFQLVDDIEKIKRSIKGMDSDTRYFTVVSTDEPSKDHVPEYCMCNIEVNFRSFKGWLVSNIDNGTFVVDYVRVIKPAKLNNMVAQIFTRRVIKYMDWMDTRHKDELLNALTEHQKQK